MAKRSVQPVEAKVPKTIPLPAIVASQRDALAVTIPALATTLVATPTARGEPPLIESNTLTPTPYAYSATQTHDISMGAVLSFCFPSSLQHPSSAGRLAVLAYHGPPSFTHSTLTCLCSSCQRMIRDARKTDEFAKRLFAGNHFTEDDLSSLPPPGLCARCTSHTRTAVHIRGGYKGQEIVSERTLDEMAKFEETSQILDAYHRRHELSKEDEARFIATIDKQKAAVRNFSPEEMRALFADVPRDQHARMNFYKFREVVDRLRAERVAQLRKMFPDVVVKRDSLLATLTPAPAAPISKAEAMSRGIVDVTEFHRSRQLKQEAKAKTKASVGGGGGGKHRRNRSLTSVYSAATTSTTTSSALNPNTAHSFVRSAPLPSITRTMAAKKKIPSHQSFTVTHRLISRYAHAIAPMSQKNNVALALNVRLMRDEY